MTVAIKPSSFRESNLEGSGKRGKGGGNELLNCPKKRGDELKGGKKKEVSGNSCRRIMEEEKGKTMRDCPKFPPTNAPTKRGGKETRNSGRRKSYYYGPMEERVRGSGKGTKPNFLAQITVG